MVVLLMLAGLLPSVGAATARAATCDTTWVGPPSGLWSDAANWSPVPPSASSVVCLGSGWVDDDVTAVVGEISATSSSQLGIASGATLTIGPSPVTGSGSSTLGQVGVNGTLSVNEDLASTNIVGGTESSTLDTGSAHVVTATVGVLGHVKGSGTVNSCDAEATFDGPVTFHLPSTCGVGQSSVYVTAGASTGGTVIVDGGLTLPVSVLGATLDAQASDTLDVYDYLPAPGSPALPSTIHLYGARLGDGAHVTGPVTVERPTTYGLLTTIPAGATVTLDGPLSYDDQSQPGPTNPTFDVQGILTGTGSIALDARSAVLQGSGGAVEVPVTNSNGAVVLDGLTLGQYTQTQNGRTTWTYGDPTAHAGTVAFNGGWLSLSGPSDAPIGASATMLAAADLQTSLPPVPPNGAHNDSRGFLPTVAGNTVTVTVHDATVHATLSSSDDYPPVGGPITLTDTLVPVDGSVDGDYVQFFLNAQQIGTGQVQNGGATFTTKNVPANLNEFEAKLFIDPYHQNVVATHYVDGGGTPPAAPQPGPPTVAPTVTPTVAPPASAAVRATLTPGNRSFTATILQSNIHTTTANGRLVGIKIQLVAADHRGGQATITFALMRTTRGWRGLITVRDPHLHLHLALHPAGAITQHGQQLTGRATGHPPSAGRPAPVLRWTL